MGRPRLALDLPPLSTFEGRLDFVADAGLDLSDALLPLRPIGPRQTAKTEVEKQGMQFVVDLPDKVFHGRETLRGSNDFAAVHPDAAVADTRVNCDSGRPNSPRKDFELGDPTGALVIRIKQ